MKFILGALQVLCWLCIPLANADLLEPLLTSNLNPFVQVYGLPATRSAALTRGGEFAWQLQFDVANTFTSANRASEVVGIDGETHRLRAQLRYGLSDRLEIAADIPYLEHSGGSLDSAIESFHELFDLPNGGRENVADDQLIYVHQNTEFPEARVSLRDSASGVGDIQLSLGYRLRQSERRAWTLRAGVKTATGDPDKLTGSGGSDFFTSLHMSDNRVFNSSRWHAHLSVGALAPGDSQVLEQQLEDLVVFGSGALAWQPWERVSLKAQIDFHSAFYDSALTQLGDPSAQLIIGGSIRLFEKTILDISVAEDIVVETSPDVVFQLGLRSHF